MAKRYWLPILILFGLAGCTRPALKPTDQPDTPPPSLSSGVDSMLACLSANDTLSPEQVRHRKAEMERQLSTTEGRFQLACLLGRNSAGDAELARAQNLLESIQQERALSIEHRQLIAFYQRYLVMAQQLRQQRRETREYQRKIEQLKGLEEELEPDSVRQETAP